MEKDYHGKEAEDKRLLEEVKLAKEKAQAAPVQISENTHSQ